MSDPCRVCDKSTNVTVNIRFKRIPVCNGCCRAITLQQVDSWATQDIAKTHLGERADEAIKGDNDE